MMRLCWRAASAQIPGRGRDLLLPAQLADLASICWREPDMGGRHLTLPSALYYERDLHLAVVQRLASTRCDPFGPTRLGLPLGDEAAGEALRANSSENSARIGTSLPPRSTTRRTGCLAARRRPGPKNASCPEEPPCRRKSERLSVRMESDNSGRPLQKVGPDLLDQRFPRPGAGSWW